MELVVQQTLKRYLLDMMANLDEQPLLSLPLAVSNLYLTATCRFV